MQKILIVITGPVCAGKSTLARALSMKLKAAVVRTEDFHRPYLAGLEKNLSKAFEDFLSAVESKLETDDIVIAEGLFLKPERRMRLWRLARGADAKLFVMTIQVEPAVLERRYSERQLAGYDKLGIRHALKLRSEFEENPWGRVIDTTRFPISEIVKQVSSECRGARNTVMEKFRVYLDNTALGDFLAFQRGVVPRWGTEQTLDLCQTLDGLVCAGSVTFLRFDKDAVYRETEKSLEELALRDFRYGNLFVPFGLEATTIRASAHVAMRATVEHLQRCAGRQEIEDTLDRVLLAGGPRDLSRHGRALGLSMRHIAEGKFARGGRDVTALGAVDWFASVLKESADSYGALKRVQEGSELSSEEYWTAVHRLFRCFLHSAFGREREAAFWSTARRSAIIQQAVLHPLATFRASTFENSLLEQWRDQQGRLFGLTGLFCQLPLFGAYLVASLSAKKWGWAQFNEGFWNLRAAPDVLSLRSHLGRFSECLRAGPSMLEEAHGALRAIECLGKQISRELRKTAGKREFSRQGGLVSAALGARRLQWLALWVNGQDACGPAGRPAFSESKPIMSTVTLSDLKQKRPRGLERRRTRTRTRVLIVFCCPKGETSLRLQQEERTVRESMFANPASRRLIVQTLPASTVDDFRRKLLREKFDVVHFSGHGSEEGVVFEDTNGMGKEVPAKALANLLKHYAPPIKCVLLNACYTLAQAKLLKGAVRVVIAMKTGISDEAAIEFSKGFYDALAAGKSARLAFDEGRRCIELEGLAEEKTPIMFEAKGRGARR